MIFYTTLKTTNHIIENTEDNFETANDIIETADDNIEMGGRKTEMGDSNIEMGDRKTEMGDCNIEMTDRKTEIADSNIEMGDRKTEMGDCYIEKGGRKTEIFLYLSVSYFGGYLNSKGSLFGVCLICDLVDLYLYFDRGATVSPVILSGFCFYLSDSVIFDF